MVNTMANTFVSSSSSPTVSLSTTSSDDPKSPYFIHPSKNHSTVVVTPELRSSNYVYWSITFMFVVSMRNKEGFLTGAILNLLRTILYLLLGEDVTIL